MGGVGEKALLRFLSDRPNIKTVYLCLDSDEAGNDACSRLVKLMPEGYTVHRLIPLFKDWNEVLQHRAEITDGKFLREAVYGLKEPPQEETVEIIRMSEVDTQTVESVSYTHLDRDGGESNSIQNQKIFLENYASGQHLTNIRHYIDDDEIGRFFDRSAYSRMMDDV